MTLAIRSDAAGGAIRSDGVDRITFDAAGNATISSPSIAGPRAFASAPVFRATMTGASNQSLTTNVSALLNFTVLSGDAQGWFSTVNKRYTPQAEGWYQFSWATLAEVASGTATAWSALFKNGAEYARVSQASSNINLASTGTVFVYMNGTTDYVDVRQTIIGTTPFVHGNPAFTNFQGCMLKAGA